MNFILRWLSRCLKWTGLLSSRHEVSPVVEPPRSPEHARPSWALRLPGGLLDVMLGDLRRPHGFAGERVGFLLAREAQGHEGQTLLLARGYEPVRDDEYLEDRCVGARINRAAIRRMMQHALAGDCVFHVHLHEDGGTPAFSGVDESNLAELVPSFCAVAPQVTHGALLLSEDEGFAQVWRSGRDAPFAISTITVVGYPLRCWEVRS